MLLLQISFLDAMHCGYRNYAPKRLLEIKRAWIVMQTVFHYIGSDDRSPDVFRERIEAATQMKAVLGADPRPNCLIIDEIDGAPQVRRLSL